MVVEKNIHWGFGIVCIALVLYQSYNSLVLVCSSCSLVCYAVDSCVLLVMVFGNEQSIHVLFCYSLMWYCADRLGLCQQIALLPNLPHLLLTPVCPIMVVGCNLSLKFLQCFVVMQDPYLAWAEIQIDWDPVKAQSF